MSILEMKVPSPGESISEVEIATWLVSDGDYVEKDQAIAEVDSDKATLELPAEQSGIITLKAAEGDVVKVGQVVCLIDTSAERPAGSAAPAAETPKVEEEVAKLPKTEASSGKDEKQKEAPAPNPGPVSDSYAKGTPSPAAAKIMAENGVSGAKINGTGKDGRITKQDVVSAMAAGIPADAAQGWGGTRDQNREKMSMLRRKIAERLVSVKNETAMLTTFNEVDMKPIMDLRAKYKDQFAKFHDVNLGFMSFFTKAVTEALNLFPAVNAQIDGNEMVFHNYADVGIAVSSPKGLMVPVVRNAEQMSLAEIEKEIKRLAVKARDGKIAPEDMTGGTFTITNGGVFGSMMSTPIINPPQSAILGMHNIIERPVAIDGKVEIRPMMYLALSYDHRIIDGKESVSFLVKVKEMIENPERIIFGGKDPHAVLLGL
ncbi:2-oxoglutarate dehydrogenase complex dihydrolipoyllysine-residue succinyltransferase [Fluviicola chungangensis]|uniref:Dihydrolipoyllysine-residue succinyltransferase component of 2-oxoglutarate dehydrogenase complex n=1 Tax=Fluviicola chungangensis TaxID=2597671 RepID=A0A556N328_9FLAO|nr:2-oxoglutarate dehydrogenase complex dihydrolipoyllysine-residue succinyltransferase [Fluviicola chungangensis]TSJ46610.1 2-oxoglutarate dehydrogenase complex dihydrolipoyllysine-residue succinyltransferase [Fluviicola chungangensis]